MKTGSKGIALIKSYEGLKLEAYKCPAGVWTIGYGHTKGVIEGQVITKDQADIFLKEDLSDAEKAVNKQNVLFTQNQFDALVSFTYNLGSGNLEMSTLLKKAKVDPNDVTIKSEFAKWNKAKGEILNGLIRRREAEANLYFEK